MSQQLLEIATRHAIVPYPMERKPCADFYDLLDPLLVPIDRAQEGDIVGIGFPITLSDDGSPVYDRAYPIAELVAKHQGGFTMASDEDIREEQFAPLMRALKCARNDPSFLNCGITAIRKLVPQLPEDGQHKGFIAWQFNGFVIGDSWTHHTPERPLIHHFSDGSKRVAPLVERVAELIASKRDCGGTFKTMRRD